MHDFKCTDDFKLLQCDRPTDIYIYSENGREGPYAVIGWRIDYIDRKEGRETEFILADPIPLTSEGEMAGWGTSAPYLLVYHSVDGGLTVFHCHHLELEYVHVQSFEEAQAWADTVLYA